MDLIRELAVPLGAGANYLEIVANVAGTVSRSYKAIRTSFQEWKWTLDTSLYFGVSGGFAPNFYGIGVAMTFNAMSGITLSHESTVREEETNSWGISADISFPGGSKPGHVRAYTTQVYLLPANNLWTTELLYLSPDPERAPIDPNAAPWKIMFLVEPRSLTFIPGQVDGAISSKEEHIVGLIGIAYKTGNEHDGFIGIGVRGAYGERMKRGALGSRHSPELRYPEGLFLTVRELRCACADADSPFERTVGSSCARHLAVARGVRAGFVECQCSAEHP